LQKLREKFAKDPEKYKTLQGIVESEIEEKTTTAKNSATDALLWLKRLVTSKMNAKNLHVFMQCTLFNVRCENLVVHQGD